MIYGITIGTFYRPQRSCGQGYIFKPVCHSVHRAAGSASVHAGMPPHTPPPRSRHPPPRPDPPRADTPPPSRTPPQSRHSPPQQTPPRPDTPPEQTPPPEADSSIRSTSGRYASYWNAFLFEMETDVDSAVF